MPLKLWQVSQCRKESSQSICKKGNGVILKTTADKNIAVSEVSGTEYNIPNTISDTFEYIIDVHCRDSLFAEITGKVCTLQVNLI